MATMERVNKTGKKRRNKRGNRTGSSHGAPPGRGQLVPAEAAARPASTMETRDSEGRPALLWTGLSRGGSRLDDLDVQDDLPLHAVLSYQPPHAASAGLRRLLEQGAAVNATSDSGRAPLHLAASRDLLDCVTMLADAGADVLARDRLGLTPLDLATSKQVARVLKHRMWHEGKRRAEEERPPPGEGRPASARRLTRDIQNVPHRRRPQGKSASPWTEVAAHLGVEEPPGRGEDRDDTRDHRGSERRGSDNKSLFYLFAM